MAALLKQIKNAETRYYNFENQIILTSLNSQNHQKILTFKNL